MFSVVARQCALPALLTIGVLLGARVSAGEDRKEKAEPSKSGRTEKAGKARLFNVDEFMKEYDTNKDGFLSKDEVPEWLRPKFDALDTNHDGKLSKEELEKGMASLQPQRRPSDVVFVLVEMSDCDSCCVEELQLIYDFLRKLDKNNNGKLDPEELKSAREQLANQRVERIFKALDTNHDGKISKEEAKGQIRRHFDDLDTNHDGFISKEELLRAALEKPSELPRTSTPSKDGEKEPRRRP